jgi:KUP system potassium uptake protein
MSSPTAGDDAPPSLRLAGRSAASGSQAESADSSGSGPNGHAQHRHPTGGSRLVIAAVGIVFGDIGTSPLYAFKECIHGEHAVSTTHDNVMGVLSLIVWSLTLVVTVKYLMFVMRADNHGEGGIFALLALVPERLRTGPKSTGWIALLVLIGAALLYGDGMITPAISVLSAVEGLEVEAHALKPWVVPITCVILVGLFWIQSHGTEGIGRFFGPIMALWFVTIGGLGLWHMAHHPAVLWAIDPRCAVRFFIEHRMHGLIVLGAVVLAITGGEALYADMGHFGRHPIRKAWLRFVFPCLLLAYFGQGALVLTDPSQAKNPFFAMAPSGAPTYALVGLATVATVIASQALISGAYSVTQQAVQLGYFPRVLVRHTSSSTIGQIYVPFINWMLAIACVILVIAFGQSSRLAAAYGIAVTGTMAITSIIYFIVTQKTWGWPLAKSVAVLVFFLAFDLPFLGANALKIVDGGWVPLLIGAAFFATMFVWRRGRRLLTDIWSERTLPVDEFMADIREPGETLDGSARQAADDRIAAGVGAKNARAPIVLEARPNGTGVFMAATADGIPPPLLHHVERIHVLHKSVVLLTIITEQVPFIAEGKRTHVEKLEHGFFRVIGKYGFMESPHVPELLAEATTAHGLDVDLDDVTYFLGRETILGLPGGKMGKIEETFFGFLSRNSRHAGQYFNLPPGQVVEIGVQVDL